MKSCPVPLALRQSISLKHQFGAGIEMKAGMAGFDAVHLHITILLDRFSLSDKLFILLQRQSLGDACGSPG